MTTISNTTFATYTIAQINALDSATLTSIANNGGWISWLSVTANQNPTILGQLSSAAQASINTAFASYSIATISTMPTAALTAIAALGGWANWLSNQANINNVSLLTGAAQLTIPLAALDSLPDSILSVVGPQLGSNILGQQTSTTQGIDFWNFYQNASPRILNATAPNVLSISMLRSWIGFNSGANAATRFGGLTAATLDGITGASVSSLIAQPYSTGWLAGVTAWINQHCGASSGADFFNLNANFQQAWFVPTFMSAAWLNSQVTVNPTFNSAIASANLKNWLSNAATTDIQTLSTGFLNSMTPTALSAMTAQSGTSSSSFSDVWLSGTGHKFSDLSAQTFAAAFSANALNQFVANVSGQNWTYGTLTAAQFSAWLGLNVPLKNAAGVLTGTSLTNNIAALSAATINAFFAHGSVTLLQSMTSTQLNSWLAGPNNNFTSLSGQVINGLAGTTPSLLSTISASTVNAWLSANGSSASFAVLTIPTINTLTGISGVVLPSNFWSAWAASNTVYAGLTGVALNSLLTSGVTGISSVNSSYSDWLSTASVNDLSALSATSWSKFQAASIASFIVQVGFPNLSSTVLNMLATAGNSSGLFISQLGSYISVAGLAAWFTAPGNDIKALSPAFWAELPPDTVALALSQKVSDGTYWAGQLTNPAHLLNQNVLLSPLLQVGALSAIAASDISNIQGNIFASLNVVALEGISSIIWSHGRSQGAAWIAANNQWLTPSSSNGLTATLAKLWVTSGINFSTVVNGLKDMTVSDFAQFNVAVLNAFSTAQRQQITGAQLGAFFANNTGTINQVTFNWSDVSTALAGLTLNQVVSLVSDSVFPHLPAAFWNNLSPSTFLGLNQSQLNLAFNNAPSATIEGLSVSRFSSLVQTTLTPAQAQDWLVTQSTANGGLSAAFVQMTDAVKLYLLSNLTGALNTISGASSIFDSMSAASIAGVAFGGLSISLLNGMKTSTLSKISGQQLSDWLNGNNGLNTLAALTPNLLLAINISQWQVLNVNNPNVLASLSNVQLNSLLGSTVGGVTLASQWASAGVTTLIASLTVAQIEGLNQQLLANVSADFLNALDPVVAQSLPVAIFGAWLDQNPAGIVGLLPAFINNLLNTGFPALLTAGQVVELSQNPAFSSVAGGFWNELRPAVFADSQITPALQTWFATQGATGTNGFGNSDYASIDAISISTFNLIAAGPTGSFANGGTGGAGVMTGDQFHSWLDAQMQTIQATLTTNGWTAPTNNPNETVSQAAFGQVFESLSGAALNSLSAQDWQNLSLLFEDGDGNGNAATIYISADTFSQLNLSQLDASTANGFDSATSENRFYGVLLGIFDADTNIGYASSMTATQIGQLQYSFGVLNTAWLSALSDDALSAISVNQIEEVTTDTISGLGSDFFNRLATTANNATALIGLDNSQVAAISITAFSGLSGTVLTNFSASGIQAISAAQMTAWDQAQDNNQDADVVNLTANFLGALAPEAIAALSGNSIVAWLNNGNTLSALSPAVVNAFSQNVWDALNTLIPTAIQTLDFSVLTSTALQYIANESNLMSQVTAAQAQSISEIVFDQLSMSDLQHYAALGGVQLDPTAANFVLGALDANTLNLLSDDTLGLLTSGEVQGWITGSTQDGTPAHAIGDLTAATLSDFSSDVLGNLSWDQLKGWLDSNGHQLGDLSGEALSGLSTSIWSTINGLSQYSVEIANVDPVAHSALFNGLSGSLIATWATQAPNILGALSAAQIQDLSDSVFADEADMTAAVYESLPASFLNGMNPDQVYAIPDDVFQNLSANVLNQLPVNSVDVGQFTEWLASSSHTVSDLSANFLNNLNQDAFQLLAGTIDGTANTPSFMLTWLDAKDGSGNLTHPLNSLSASALDQMMDPSWTPLIEAANQLNGLIAQLNNLVNAGVALPISLSDITAAINDYEASLSAMNSSPWAVLWSNINNDTALSSQITGLPIPVDLINAWTTFGDTNLVSKVNVSIIAPTEFASLTETAIEKLTESEMTSLQLAAWSQAFPNMPVSVSFLEKATDSQLSGFQASNYGAMSTADFATLTLTDLNRIGVNLSDISGSQLIDWILNQVNNGASIDTVLTGLNTDAFNALQPAMLNVMSVVAGDTSAAPLDPTATTALSNWLHSDPTHVVPNFASQITVTLVNSLNLNYPNWVKDFTPAFVTGISSDAFGALTHQDLVQMINVPASLGSLTAAQVNALIQNNPAAFNGLGAQGLTFWQDLSAQTQQDLSNITTYPIAASSSNPEGNPALFLLGTAVHQEYAIQNSPVDINLGSVSTDVLGAIDATTLGEISSASFTALNSDQMSTVLGKLTAGQQTSVQNALLTYVSQASAGGSTTLTIQGVSSSFLLPANQSSLIQSTAALSNKAQSDNLDSSKANAAGGFRTLYLISNYMSGVVALIGLVYQQFKAIFGVDISELSESDAAFLNRVSVTVGNYQAVRALASMGLIIGDLANAGIMAATNGQDGATYNGVPGSGLIKNQGQNWVAALNAISAVKVFTSALQIFVAAGLAAYFTNRDVLASLIQATATDISNVNPDLAQKLADYVGVTKTVKDLVSAKTVTQQDLDVLTSFTSAQKAGLADLTLLNNLTPAQLKTLQGMTEDQFAVAQKLSPGQLDGLHLMTLDQLDKLQGLTLDQLTAIQKLTSDQLSALGSVGTDAYNNQGLTPAETQGLETLFPEQIAALKTVTAAQLATLRTMTPDQLISFQGFSSDEITALEAMTTDQLNTFSLLAKDQFNSFESLTADQISVLKKLPTSILDTLGNGGELSASDLGLVANGLLDANVSIKSIMEAAQGGDNSALTKLVKDGLLSEADVATIKAQAGLRTGITSAQDVAALQSKVSDLLALNKTVTNLESAGTLKADVINKLVTLGVEDRNGYSIKLDGVKIYGYTPLDADGNPTILSGKSASEKYQYTGTLDLELNPTPAIPDAILNLYKEKVLTAQQIADIQAGKSNLTQADIDSIAITGPMSEGATEALPSGVLSEQNVQAIRERALKYQVTGSFKKGALSKFSPLEVLVPNLMKGNNSAQVRPDPNGLDAGFQTVKRATFKENGATFQEVEMTKFNNSNGKQQTVALHDATSEFPTVQRSQVDSHMEFIPIGDDEIPSGGEGNIRVRDLMDPDIRQNLMSQLEQVATNANTSTNNNAQVNSEQQKQQAMEEQQKVVDSAQNKVDLLVQRQGLLQNELGALAPRQQQMQAQVDNLNIQKLRAEYALTDAKQALYEYYATEAQSFSSAGSPSRTRGRGTLPENISSLLNKYGLQSDSMPIRLTDGRYQVKIYDATGGGSKTETFRSTLGTNDASTRATQAYGRAQKNILEALVKEVATDFGIQQGRAGQIVSELTGLAIAASDAEKSYTSTNGAYNTAKAQVNALTEQATNLRSRLTDLSTQMTTAQQDVRKAQTDLDVIEFGGDANNQPRGGGGNDNVGVIGEGGDHPLVEPDGSDPSSEDSSSSSHSSSDVSSDHTSVTTEPGADIADIDAIPVANAEKRTLELPNENWKEGGWKKTAQGAIWIVADTMSIVELIATLYAIKGFSQMTDMQKAQTIIGSIALNFFVLGGDLMKIKASTTVDDIGVTANDVSLLKGATIFGGIAGALMVASLTMSLVQTVQDAASYANNPDLSGYAKGQIAAVAITGAAGLIGMGAAIFMLAAGPVGLGVGLALTLLMPNVLEIGFSNYYLGFEDLCYDYNLSGDGLFYNKLFKIAALEAAPLINMFAAAIIDGVGKEFAKAMGDYTTYAQKVAVQRVAELLAMLVNGTSLSTGLATDLMNALPGKAWRVTGNILTQAFPGNSDDVKKLMGIVETDQDSLNGMATAMVDTLKQAIGMSKQVFAFSQLSSTVDVRQLLPGYTPKTASAYYVLEASQTATGGVLQAFEANTYDQDGVNVLTKDVDGNLNAISSASTTSNTGSTTFDAMYMLNYTGVNYTFTEKDGGNYFFLMGALLNQLTINTYTASQVILQIALDMVDDNSLIQVNTTQSKDSQGNDINTGYTMIQFVAPVTPTTATININLAKLTNDSIHSLVAPVMAGLNYNFYSGDNATDHNIMTGAGNFYAGLGGDVEEGTGRAPGQSAPVTGTVPIATNLYSNLASRNGIQFIVAGQDVNVFGNATIEGASAAYNMSAADTVTFDSRSAASISQLLDLSVTDGQFTSVVNSDGNTTDYFDGSKGFWTPTNDPTDISSLQSVPNYVFAPGATSGAIRVDTMTVHGSNENIIGMSDSTTSYAGTLVVNIDGERAPTGDTNAGSIVGGTGNSIQGGRGNLIVTTDTDGNWISTGLGAYNFMYEAPGTLSTSSDGSSVDLNPTNTNSLTNGGAAGSYAQYSVVDNFGSYAKNAVYFNAGSKSSLIVGLGESDLIFNDKAQTIGNVTFNQAMYSDIYETDATLQSGSVFFNFVADDNALSTTQTSNGASKAGNVLTLTADKDNVTGMLDSITMTLGNGTTTGTTKDDLTAETTNDSVTAVLHLLNQTAMTNLATYNASTSTYGANTSHALSTAGGVVSDNGGTVSTYFSQNATLDPNDLAHGVVDNTKAAGSWQDIHIQFWNQDTSGNLTAGNTYSINVSDLITNGTIKV